MLRHVAKQHFFQCFRINRLIKISGRNFWRINLNQIRIIRQKHDFFNIVCLKRNRSLILVKKRFFIMIRFAIHGRPSMLTVSTIKCFIFLLFWSPSTIFSIITFLTTESNKLKDCSNSKRLLLKNNITNLLHIFITSVTYKNHR